MSLVINDNILHTDRDANHRSYQDIPEDLWIKILVRLSVKSLRHARCVCTLLYSLVNNDSFFANKHLEFQKKTYNKKNETFVLWYDYYWMEAGRPIYMLFDANGTNLSSSSTILLDPALHQPHCKELSFFGPVNGLYCVYNGIHNFVIWNPAMEEVGFLPSAAELLPTTDSTPDSLADPLTIYHAYVGFGVDPINERDYKLVMICKYNRLTSRDDKGFSRMLYTTRTNRWRLIDDNGFVGEIDAFPYDSKNTYLNGFYYWGVRREGGLLVFDMGQKENFHTVCGPDNISYLDRNEIVLHNNHISVIIVHDTPCEIDIWVLHEEVSKWTKTTSVIGVPWILTSRGFLSNNDDELLLLIDDARQIYARQIVLYNTSTQKVEKNIGPPGNVMSKITIGYESVISLSGMGMTTYRGNYGSSADAISRFLFQSSSTE